MKKPTKLIQFQLWSLAILATSSCSFNFELTSQRTALENQIMGTYKEIDDDLLVTSNEKQTGALDAKSASRNKASIGKEKANKNRLFNADDIKDLKDSAFIGERSDGELAILPKGIGDIANATPDQIKLAEAIIDEENKDRSVIWKSSLSEDANLTEKDLPFIQEKFAREIYEKSASGHWFYAGSRWTVKQ